MAVPYTFGAATAAIPLSQLDSNFASTITLGNTAIQLGNTVTILNNMTFANVTISSGSVTITDVTASGNVTISGGTANGVAYLNGSKILTTGTGLVFDATNTRLGIGTATPSSILHLYEASPLISATSTNNSSGLRFNVEGTASTVYRFQYGGSTLMTLDASGNLLVGTTSAGAKVYAVASGSQQAVRGDQSTAGAAAFYGTSSVNSGTGYVAYFTNSGSGTGLYISNTAAWQSTSDERLKTDIQDLDSTQRLLQLRPVDYLWKSQETSDEPTKRNLGFIAQEVKELFPELVGVSPDGMFSVEYTGLIAPLVKAIQELKAEFDAYKSEHP